MDADDASTPIRPDGERNRFKPTTRKTLNALGVVAGVVLALLFLWQVANVLLLLFGGVLLAVFLNGLASQLSEQSGLSYGWSLAAVLLCLLAFFVAVGWTLAPQIARETSQLSETLPEAVENVEAFLNRYPWGEYLTENVPPAEDVLGGQSDLWARVTGIFSTALGVFANTIFILITGIYLAVNPGLYRRGIIRLIPLANRARAREVLDALGEALWSWLIGILISMTLVGVLAWLGLTLLGVSLSLALGFIAGLLEFVPLIGPWASAIPAVLIGLMDGPSTALYVGLLYLGIQQLEGNLITPIVMKKAVALPPVLTLSATVISGVFFGLPGVLLATPLAVVVMVLVRMLYVEDVLGDRMGDPASAGSES